MQFANCICNMQLCGLIRTQGKNIFADRALELFQLVANIRRSPPAPRIPGCSVFPPRYRDAGSLFMFRFDGSGRICIGWNTNPLPRRPLMKPNTKILCFLILFAVIDTVIPVPITAIIMIYVLLEKPGWFERLIGQIYDAKRIRD